ncbi:MAG: PQQ-binding-like beta-propeller repeat protein [Alistipes sp.]|nr:PQQ-binding-like beta-propeller repeat protein [Alistipes sp.]
MRKMFLRGAMAAVAVVMTMVASAQVTPYGWRGPARNGVYPETGLLKQWPASGPEKLWETMDAGKGYSSPVVVGDKIYLTGMNEDQSMETFSAYTLEGKKLYTVEYSKPWDQTYPETRTTPAIVDGKAYVISGSGEIVCISTADGKIVWKVNGGEVYSRKTGNWGTSECPLVFDNKVIFTPAGDKTTMVALDAQTGKEVWKTKSWGDVGAYVSPMLIEYKGKRQIIGSTAVHIFGVNPSTGEIEWDFTEWGTERNSTGWASIAPNTPLFKDGKIFFGHGYDIYSYMLQLADDMKSVKLLWKNETLDTHHGGYVEIDGVIYGSNHHNNGQGTWIAVDWNTGKTLYDHNWENKGKGSIIAADGMLYCYNERTGAVALVKPLRDKFEIVSQFRVTKGDGPHWAHPVIVNGVMYLRHGSAFMAYKVK